MVKKTNPVVANIILEGRFGGPQNRILQVSAGLKKSGIETVVILPKQESDFFYKKLTENNITAKRFSLHRLTKEKKHLTVGIMTFIPEVFSLYRYIKKNKFPIVHCNSIWHITSIIASTLAGAKTIMHLNDTWTPWGIRFLFKILGPFCDAYILSSEKTRECYFNKGVIKKKYAIIHPPVDTSFLNPTGIDEDNELKKSRLMITTIANINPIKCLESFIYMASVLGRKYGNVSFHIFGRCFPSQASYFLKLKNLIEKLQIENLYFHGESDNVRKVLKATDIFVCTSLSESGPMTVFEAMAMGKAIVSTDVGDIKYFLTNGECGFVVPPRDNGALAEKVSILIGDADLRATFGRRARSIAVKELDLKICTEKYHKFYVDVLNE